MCKYDEAFTEKEMLEETGFCKGCGLDCPNAGKQNDERSHTLSKEEIKKEMLEYLSDADKCISEDEEYIRGWKSAFLVALELISNLDGV